MPCARSFTSLPDHRVNLLLVLPITIPKSHNQPHLWRTLQHPLGPFPALEDGNIGLACLLYQHVKTFPEHDGTVPPAPAYVVGG